MRQIADIFPYHRLALNLIHFHTNESAALYEQLLQISRFGGPNLHGFQLNVAWPAPSVLDKYLIINPMARFVLQIGGRAFEMVEHSPKKLSQKVGDYAGLIRYVLLDPSGGKGQQSNPAELQQYVETIKERGLRIRIGVIGGLAPNTLEAIAPLVKKFPDLCLDAEGRLRDAQDRIDLAAVKTYLQKSLKMFSGDY